MATQGLISIVKDNSVQTKIVTGTNGYHIPIMKAWLFENPDADMQSIHDKAVELFSDTSLVVQTGDNEFFSGFEYDEPGGYYLTEFANPHFNPRWKHGTADYSAVIESDPSPQLQQVYAAEARITKRAFDRVSIHKIANKDEYLFLTDDSKLIFNKKQLQGAIKLGTSPFMDDFQDSLLAMDEFDINNETLQEIASYYFPVHATRLTSSEEADVLRNKHMQITSYDGTRSTGARGSYWDETWSRGVEMEIKRNNALCRNMGNEAAL